MSEAIEGTDIEAWVKLQLKRELQGLTVDCLKKDTVNWQDLEDYVVRLFITRNPNTPHTLKVRQIVQRFIVEYRQQ